MGQKVNPISMRIQVTKDWRSKWFVSKREFADFLNQDIEARKYIESRYVNGSIIGDVRIERSGGEILITIHTSKPGIVIGRGGSGSQEMVARLSQIFNTKNVRINIIEIKRSELNAKLVAENIASQLQRRIPFRRAMKFAASSTMRAGAKGIKIELGGRLNGAEMARREKESQGSVPLHTLRSDIDYHLATAKTQAGTIGVKVWIYKGEM
jgi:small subunit ribosomal protein S3